MNGMSIRRGACAGLSVALVVVAFALPRAADSASAKSPPVGSVGGEVGLAKSGYRAQSIGNFDNPVSVTGPTGARGVLFVVEKAGKIEAVGPNGHTSTFLNITKQVDEVGDGGLLSVAFSPDYRKNGRLYAFLTGNSGDVVIAEYKRSAANHRRARAKSRRVVLRIDHPLQGHYGGTVAFGRDDYLYVGTGDGDGNGSDPNENAQNLDSLFGKLIRIDPQRSGSQSYTIPSSNPFVGLPGRDEIYSYGFRNPFRFSFDRQDGHLAIGDVGQSTWEEIDFLTPATAKGANFGWDAYEGFDPFDSPDASPIPAGPLTPPIFEYKHVDGNCAVIGGYVSRDPDIPSLFGRYLYADYCTGDIRSLIPSDGGSTDDRSLGLPAFAGITGFGEDTKGRLYVADIASDAVFMISPAG